MSIKLVALDKKFNLLFAFHKRVENITVPDHLMKTLGKLHNIFITTSDSLLETIVIKQIDKNFGSLEETKCWTFFSNATKKWRNFKGQMTKIFIGMKPRSLIKSLPFISHFYVSIHSPNYLPDFSTSVEFKRVIIGQVADVTYSEIRIKRLGEGYDTDCHSYESTPNTVIIE